MQKIKDRDEAIFMARVYGARIEDIAGDYGIPSQTVKGIVDRFLRKAIRYDIEIKERERQISILQRMLREEKSFRLSMEANDNRIEHKKIDDCDLSARAKNALYKFGVLTKHQLMQMDEVDILRIPKLGRKTMREINEFKAGNRHT